MEPNHPPRNEQINLHQYWRIVMERRWLVLTTFLSIILLSIFYLYRTPRVYAGIAQIRIDAEADAVMSSIKDVTQMGSYQQDYLATEYKLLQTRRLIEQVIATQGLQSDPRYSKATDTYKAVLRDISIIPIRLSRLVNIRADHTDPQKATDIANAMARIFIEQNLAQKTDKTKAAIDMLATETETLRTNVHFADQNLQKFKEDNRVLSMDENNNNTAQALKDAQENLDKTKAILAEKRSTWLDVSNKVINGMNKETIPSIVQSLVIIDLKKSFAAKESTLAQLRTTYKDKYPTVQEVINEIHSDEMAIDKEADRIYESLETEVNNAADAVVAAQALYNDQMTKNLSMSKIRLDMLDLQREADQSKILYDSVASRIKETTLSEKIKANNISLVDPARKPESPVKPNKTLVLFFGVFGGLMCAFALAFVVNYLDNSIKGQEDVEAYLGLPFLGYVPHIETVNPLDRDLEAHLHPSSSASEGFRTIRASVSLSNLPEKLRSIAVASTAPAEGKSLVASNLAIVTAQAGLRTLLVEADLRRPSVHKTFQLHSPVGLATYLQGRVHSIDEIIHKTEIKNLEVICCGAIPSNPSELIGSTKMTEFIRDAMKRYDRVVLDCPPISAVSDPLIVAAKSDGLIFVTRFNKIRREYAHKTVRRVQDAGIHVLGAIINNIDFEGRDSYYYSQYYYQNRYYSTHYKSEEEAPKKENIT